MNPLLLVAGEGAAYLVCMAASTLAVAFLITHWRKSRMDPLAPLTSAVSTLETNGASAVSTITTLRNASSNTVDPSAVAALADRITTVATNLADAVTPPPVSSGTTAPTSGTTVSSGGFTTPVANG